MAKLKKIMMAIGSTSPHRGGAENQCIMLSEELLRRGYQVAIVCFIHDGEGFLDKRIKVYNAGMRKNGNLLKRAKNIYHAIKDFSPDVIHTWVPEIMALFATFAGRRYNIPVMTSRRSTYKPIRMGGILRDYINIFAELLSQKVVSNTKVFKSNGWLYHKVFTITRGIVIPNGLDLNITTNHNEISKIKQKNDFKIVYVGRFIETKRIDLLIRAFCKLRDDGINASLYLYGGTQSDIPNFASVKECYDKHSAYIFPMGRIANWRAIAPAFDMFVQPSVLEGMSNALLEAFSVNLPVVATDIPANTAICENNVSALLATPNDEIELYNCMKRLISDNMLQKTLIENAKKILNKYSIDNMTNSYLTIYKSLLK